MVALQAATGVVYDESFRARVRFFVTKAAVAATTEAASAYVNHLSRVDLAKQILQNPSAYEGQFALAIMTNPTNLAKATLADVVDNDIEFSVNSIYDSFT